MPARIRRMREADLPSVVELMKADANVAFCEWEASTLERMLTVDSGRVLLVAESNKKVVAALIGGSTPEVDNFEARGTISHIFVDAKFRTRGIGTELAKQAMEQLKDQGVKTVHLMVTTPSLCGYWEKLGFEIVDSGFLESEIEVSGKALTSSTTTSFESDGVCVFDVGVRGVMHFNLGDDRTMLNPTELEGAFEWFAERGVHRVHVLTKAPLLPLNAFSQPEGEFLLEYRL